MPRPDANEPLSVTNNTISLLKVRNISLTNKITTLRREIADISGYKTEYEQKNVALETNLTLFKLYWLEHINELKLLRQQQKPFNDQKLQEEFEECFSVAQTALDALAFQQPHDEFREKTAQMFLLVSKAHKDIITGSQRVLEGAIEKLTLEIEQNGDNKEEGLNALTTFQQKLKELNDSVDTIKGIHMKLEHNESLSEMQALKKKVEKLEEELADVKEYNEVLNRRYKVSLKGFVEVDEDLEKEIELGCICGGKLFDYLTIENVKVSKEVEEDEMEEKKVSDETVEATNKDIAILNQKIEKLEKDLQEITEEKLNLVIQNEKLRQDKKNMDEVFFNSKLYNSVVLQAQELLKYINMLKSKIGQYEKIIKDFEKTRTTEIEEVFKKSAEEKDKLVNMIKEISLSYDNEKKKFEQLETELVKEYDLSVKFSNFLQIMEQNDQKYLTLNKENELLRGQLKELNEALQIANSQVTELSDKVNQLNQINLKLKAVTGEIKLDDMAFRHSKHREFLNEMHSINKKLNLNIREKIDDLKLYIKTREEKVEHMEAKIKNLNSEVEKGKKQAGDLFKEFDLMTKISSETEQKYQQLNSQVRNQNENFANLVKEKVNDRTQFDQEKAALQGKIKSDGEFIEKLQNHIGDLNAKIQALMETKEITEELVLAQKEAIEDSKNIRENLLKNIEEQKNELGISKESYETLDQAQKDLLKENENLKKSLKEKNGIISQKLQRLKRMSNDATITDDEEVEFLKLENERFKKMITCSVCGLKEKACVLAKCFHTFCRPCITGTMEARNRRCPVCKNKIGIDDIKTLHWDV